MIRVRDHAIFFIYPLCLNLATDCDASIERREERAEMWLDDTELFGRALGPDLTLQGV